jgi:SAM-dependent methyltransferase
MSGIGRYEEIQWGFDKAAARYDEEMGANPAMRFMRNVSLQTLVDRFHPGQRVLEIGCGTGQEAIHLALHGVHVLATDLSQEMVALTQQKVQAEGLADRVAVRRLAAGELGTLIDELGANGFDGAYSSFGPLNGEPNLEVVARPLAQLIRPGGWVVASLMNRFYPFETLWYLLHCRPKQAIRRWGGRAIAGVSSAIPARIPTWYCTPAAFARVFSPLFRRISCRALPCLLPPPYLADLWLRHPRLIDWLWPWEGRLAGSRPFSGLGDHFLMVLQRDES